MALRLLRPAGAELRTIGPRVRSTVDNDLFSAVLSPGSDDLHYAVGLGAAFTRIQLDLAADFSDLSDTLSLSAIFSF